jgi:hypothetical protein
VNALDKVSKKPEEALELLRSIRSEARHAYEYAGEYESAYFERIFKDIDDFIGRPGPAPGDADDFIPPDEAPF